MSKTPCIHGARLKRAIERAKEWAVENKQPLSLERAAVFLGINREQLLGLTGDKAFADEFPTDAARLRSLYAFCNAEMADALIKAGRQTGVLMLAKNNYRYEQGEAQAGGGVPIFVGEDELTG